MIALHTRIGANYDEPSGEGYFSPQINSDETHLHSPYWILVARTISLSDGDNLLEIIAIPSDVLDATNEPTTETIHVCLQAHLRIDDGCEVLSMAFYSDDGNSSLSPNLDIDAESMEGRQSLGLIVRNGMNEELWKFQYNDILFEFCDLDINNKKVCIPTKAKNEGYWPTLSTSTDEEGESNLKSKYTSDHPLVLFVMFLIPSNSLTQGESLVHEIAAAYLFRELNWASVDREEPVACLHLELRIHWRYLIWKRMKSVMTIRMSLLMMSIK
jgi:hypothetical protein